MNWKSWWPEKNTKQGKFSYGGLSYTVDSVKISSIYINAGNAENKATTILHVLPLSPDSVRIRWMGSTVTATNPFQRVRDFLFAKKLENQTGNLLDTLTRFYSETTNIYGAEITQVAVVDSILISTLGQSTGYPSTAFIYGLIDELRDYIHGRSAKETGFPMLHILAKDSMHYEVKVALPVDKKLETSGRISYRWMLGGGNILTTEVIGGPYTIRQKFRQMEYYMTDHQRIPVAIPFQSLVTDRREQPDTSKWVTRLYYPVI
jgi:hypothetical protein